MAGPVQGHLLTVCGCSQVNILFLVFRHKKGDAFSYLAGGLSCVVRLRSLWLLVTSSGWSLRVPGVTVRSAVVPVLVSLSHPWPGLSQMMFRIEIFLE